MLAKTLRIPSLFLSLFFAISCLDLSAAEAERATPLLKATAHVNDGTLCICLVAPKHLTTNQGYKLFSGDGGRGLESDFIFTNLPSENPKMIHFSVFAKNTADGVDCVIDEMQLFEEQGWFSDSFVWKETSQLIHIQNNTVNMSVEPEKRTARNVFNNSAVVCFALSPPR